MDVDVDVDVDVEVRLKGALESLSVAGARVAELAQEATQARFELEDAQVVLATAETKVGGARETESRRQKGREKATPGILYRGLQGMCVCSVR